jgi:hypothetical protein
VTGWYWLDKVALGLQIRVVQLRWRWRNPIANLELEMRTDRGWKREHVGLFRGDTAEVSDDNGPVMRIRRR